MQLKFLRPLSLTFFLIFSPLAHTASQCDLLFNLGMFEDAQEICTQAAEAGDGNAARHLSAMANATGDKRSTTQWLQQAAKLRDPEALYNLGYAHFHGVNVPVDKEKAIEFYKQSASLGYPQAQFDLAELMLAHGKPRENAYGLYQQAAHSGHTPSQLKLAQYYLEQGKRSEALHWIHQAEAAGDDNAMYMLGVLTSDSNPAASLSWYEKAVAKGNPFAAHNLARLHMSGDQVPKDYGKALKLVDLALAKGLTQSQPLKNEILKRMGRNTPATSVAQAPKSTPSKSLPKTITVSSKASASDIARTREWLFSQPKNHYVLQLGSFRDTDNVQRYIKKHQLGPDSFYYPSRHKNAPIYILMKGPFKTRQAAKQALDLLAPAVKKRQPYLKTFATVQKRRQY